MLHCFKYQNSYVISVMVIGAETDWKCLIDTKIALAIGMLKIASLTKGL